MGPVVYDPGLLCGGCGHPRGASGCDLVLLCQSSGAVCASHQTRGREDKGEERSH